MALLMAKYGSFSVYILVVSYFFSKIVLSAMKHSRLVRMYTEYYIPLLC